MFKIYGWFWRYRLILKLGPSQSILDCGNLNTQAPLLKAPARLDLGLLVLEIEHWISSRQLSATVRGQCKRPMRILTPGPYSYIDETYFQRFWTIFKHNNIKTSFLVSVFNSSWLWNIWAWQIKWNTFSKMSYKLDFWSLYSPWKCSIFHCSLRYNVCLHFPDLFLLIIRENVIF